MTGIPLPAPVLEALALLPNGLQLPAHRAWLMADSQRLAEAMRRIEAQVIAPTAMAELWLWLAHLVIDCGSRASTTGESYARTVGRWLQWCAANGVDHAVVTVTEFDRWQRWLAIECRNGAVWRRRQVHALRGFYDWRRSRGIAATNLAADITGPRVKPKPARKYTDDHLRALFRSIEQMPQVRQVRDRCALLLLLATGMRREELCTLRLEQLELTARTGVVRITGKGAKERDVPFEGPVAASVHAWLEQREALPFQLDSTALFVSLSTGTRGQALSLRSFETMVAHHAKRAKLREWGIHRFRVTFATQLYDEGADIETIRALMGHESIETTRRYLAVSERARRTRLSADRQHRVLGTKPTGTPLWARIATGEVVRD
ncbi:MULTISPECIES: tyrosine-type recombinase/integrase [unclassified Xanthomonas]|uniref:tyrosine-type recombinase/integrase n=1 Tax=unclassified Xanthomonas TaxID=2643310 RepID=UPI0028832094|nr:MULTISPECIES: tyrosine-type recombinase/integrase [unclassified Xanthomonas]